MIIFGCSDGTKHYQEWIKKILQTLFDQYDREQELYTLDGTPASYIRDPKLIMLIIPSGLSWIENKQVNTPPVECVLEVKRRAVNRWKS